MLVLATAIVFLAVSAGTAALALKLRGAHTRAVDRLRVRTQMVSGFLPVPSQIWRQLVAWVGSVVPASPKNLPLLKRRLIRAGFRNASAARFFFGARACSTVAFSAGGLLCGLRAYASQENLFLVTVAAGLAGFLAPMQYILWRVKRRQRAIGRALPNILDLLVVCVESGLGLDQAIIQVAKELHVAHPELCEELAVVNLELRAGKRRVEALHNLGERTGVDDVRKLVAVLIQTDRFGTSIAQSLRGHADYLRVMARQRAEEKAAKLAVKLVFPVFFCVLPSLFVVTVGPVLTRLVRDLFPMVENM